MTTKDKSALNGLFIFLGFTDNDIKAPPILFLFYRYLIISANFELFCVFQFLDFKISKFWNFKSAIRVVFDKSKIL